MILLLTSCYHERSLGCALRPRAENVHPRDGSARGDALGWRGPGAGVETNRRAALPALGAGSASPRVLQFHPGLDQRHRLPRSLLGAPAGPSGRTRLAVSRRPAGAALGGAMRPRAGRERPSARRSLPDDDCGGVALALVLRRIAGRLHQPHGLPNGDIPGTRRASTRVLQQPQRLSSISSFRP